MAVQATCSSGVGSCVDTTSTLPLASLPPPPTPQPTDDDVSVLVEEMACQGWFYFVEPSIPKAQQLGDIVLAPLGRRSRSMWRQRITQNALTLYRHLIDLSSQRGVYPPTRLILRDILLQGIPGAERLALLPKLRGPLTTIQNLVANVIERRNDWLSIEAELRGVIAGTSNDEPPSLMAHHDLFCKPPSPDDRGAHLFGTTGDFWLASVRLRFLGRSDPQGG